MKIKIFLFTLFLIKKINLMIDYCTTRLNPKEPNDCVFFAYNNKNVVLILIINHNVFLNHRIKNYYVKKIIFIIS